MKAALSIVLAGLLVTTPLKLALAQAAQQEAVSVQQTAPPDSSGHRLIRVASRDRHTSRLWEPLAGKDAIADIFAEDGSIPGSTPRDMTRGAKDVAIYIVVGLVITALVLFGLAVYHRRGG